MMVQPSREDLASFAKFVKEFEKSDFISGKMHSSEQRDENLYTLPYWELSDIVSEWERALYDRHVLDSTSNYLSEEFSAQMRELEKDPTLLDSQDLQTIRTVLTFIVRGERFCDGLIAAMFENGIAQIATKRLVKLTDIKCPRKLKYCF